MQQKNTFTKKVWVVLAATFILVSLSGFFVYSSLTNIINDITEEAQPDETVILMKELIYDIADAEKNVKSYSLTADNIYLEKYNETFSSVQAKLKELEQAQFKDEHSKSDVDSLENLIDLKFKLLENLLILKSESRVESALDKVVNSIESTETTNVVKEKEAKIEEENFFKRLVNKRKEKSEEAVPEESIENLTTVDLQKEVKKIKHEEAMLDKSNREAELSLIEEDKKVMDAILAIFSRMEERETLSMEEKLILANAQGSRTKLLIAVFCILTCLLLFGAGLMVNKYVVKNDAYKKALRQAKYETDLKNQEITDSIIYAQRIQEAILPDKDKMKTYLKQSFILYKPKDIVAGDFYWTVKIEDTVYFAVGDCTGHGVPGAMVSVVCNNALNRSVREFGLKKPADILEKCRDLVIETFATGNHNVNDGMDIALVAMQESSPQNDKIEIQYAGANCPLYVITNGVLQEVAPDKQPIGKYQFQEAFTNHNLVLDKNAVIYLFSDGLADQFGGPKGKKFKYKAFQELLRLNSKNEMQLQERNIEFAFTNWRGELEQVDDVCVIGVRV